MHRDKTRYDRTTRRKLKETVNKYEFCVECKICHKPFEPEFGEEICPECGGGNGR